MTAVAHPNACALALQLSSAPESAFGVGARLHARPQEPMRLVPKSRPILQATVQPGLGGAVQGPEFYQPPGAPWQPGPDQ